MTETIIEKLRGLSEADQKAVLDVIEEKASAAQTRTSKSFLERVTEISQQVPDEEWAKLPSDGSVNHDHYLYGAPKRY
ncbi:MAG: hypothetical protein ABL999_13715 [Pyrinomonadaceae bacterium]